MKYIPRDLAFAKLKALAEGAAIVRRELTGVRRWTARCANPDRARSILEAQGELHWVSRVAREAIRRSARVEGL